MGQTGCGALERSLEDHRKKLPLANGVREAGLIAGEFCKWVWAEEALWKQQKRSKGKRMVTAHSQVLFFPVTWEWTFTLSRVRRWERLLSASVGAVASPGSSGAQEGRATSPLVTMLSEKRGSGCAVLWVNCWQKCLRVAGCLHVGRNAQPYFERCHVSYRLPICCYPWHQLTNRFIVAPFLALVWISIRA